MTDTLCLSPERPTMSPENNPISIDQLPPENDKLKAADLTGTSPALRWLDNFWYHYKWTVIVVAFFVSVAVIGIVQMASRPQYDSTVVIASHYRMDSEEREAMTRLLSSICNDYDENGESSVNIMIYEIYSQAEYDSIADVYEAQTDHFDFNRKYNSDEYNNFNQYTMTGEASIYILSPYLYEILRQADRLMPLSEIYGDEPLPPGVREDGYGIDLSETVFYQYNPAAKEGLTESAILCFHRPTVSGHSSDKSVLENEKKFFRAINALTVLSGDEMPVEPAED